MNYKILFLFAIAAISTIGVHGQKVHNIMFCDTNDRKIGPSVEVDNDRAMEEIGDIAGYIGYQYIEYVYNGDRCNKQNLINVLNSLNSGPNDIIIFYYSGHGTHAPGQTEDKFPQLLLNSRVQSNFVPARIVNEMLSKKPHRLRLILTDCCNNLVEGVSPKSSLSDMNSVTSVKSKDVINYKKLFTQQKGMIMATGCKLGQTSLGLDEDGGLFSIALWDAIYKECSEGNNPSWQNVFRNTAKETMIMANKFSGHQQEPYFAIEVSDLGANTPSSNVTPPTPPSVPVISTTSTLSASIATLLSQQNGDARANVMNQLLKSRFSNGGYFVTLGRDLKTVVDYEEADVFLRRLVSSRNIIKINIIKEETASDGKPFITVTEMRKGY